MENFGDPQDNQNYLKQKKVISLKKPALTKPLVSIVRGAAAWSMASAAVVSTSNWDDSFLARVVVFSHSASTSPSTQ